MTKEVLAALSALRAFEFEQLAKPSGLRNWEGHGALMANLRLAEREALKLRAEGLL